MDRGIALVSMAVAIAPGATSMNDIALLAAHQEPVFGAAPSDTTVRRTLELAGERTPDKIAKVRARVRAHVWSLIAATPAGFPWLTVAGKLELADLHGELAGIGRRSAIFPPASTINITGGADCVTAAQSTPGSQARAGLRIYANGQRSGWLAADSPSSSLSHGDVTQGIRRLLTALTDIPRALPGRVAIGVGIGRRVQLPPQDWLSPQDLILHEQHVADHLGGRLLALLAEEAPTGPPNPAKA